MGFHLTSPAPEKGDPTAEKRVWGFFGDAQQSHRENRPQPKQPRQGNHLITTKTALGRAYWPSRDPIGERGGVNLYGMVRNDTVGRWDYLGLYWRDQSIELKADYSLNKLSWANHLFNTREKNTIAFARINLNLSCDQETGALSGSWSTGWTWTSDEIDHDNLSNLDGKSGKIDDANSSITINLSGGIVDRLGSAIDGGVVGAGSSAAYGAVAGGPPGAAAGAIGGGLTGAISGAVFAPDQSSTINDELSFKCICKTHWEFGKYWYVSEKKKLLYYKGSTYVKWRSNTGYCPDKFDDE